MKGRSVSRELAIIAVFVVVTIVMTWPWVLHLRDAVADRGDSYAHAYFLWWGYHQTFRDPLHLFEANIFYPYHNTFAFGENDFGIGILCFPLFALGLRPLTVQSLATLAGFAFSGYGAFRLARTLTGSNGAAWIAGFIFAFIPYRFDQLVHLPLLFSGWIPLTLEALVLFVRGPSWRRAWWLGLSFWMNALTCLTWFILTLIPLSVSAVILVVRSRAWHERTLWLRGGAVAVVMTLALLPFLLPFYYVSKSHGFSRVDEEVAAYSAMPVNWLVVGGQNKLWAGLGVADASDELRLFPGLLPPLLSLAACLLLVQVSPRDRLPAETAPFFSRALPIVLDALALTFTLLAILSVGYGKVSLRLHGFQVFKVSEPDRVLFFLVMTLLLRFLLLAPRAARAIREVDWAQTFRSAHFEAALHGGAWVILGFSGAFGINFFFHRSLYELVPLFRSMRVAARWSMICYLGLAVLAGLGAGRLVSRISNRRRHVSAALVFAVIAGAVLFEQRNAPLNLLQGEAGPNQLALRLEQTPMRGGILELPAGALNETYMLRATDHARPLVNATSSFMPPLEYQLERMTAGPVIPANFLDLIESIPVSYLAVHNALISPKVRASLESLLNTGIYEGRIRFIRSYTEESSNGLPARDDLYAVLKVEPQAQSEGARRPPSVYSELAPLWTTLPPEFEHPGYFIYRLYKASFGRMPKLEEFDRALQDFRKRGVTGSTDSEPVFEEEAARGLLAAWAQQERFRSAHAAESDEQYVASLFDNAGIWAGDGERELLTEALRAGRETRASVLFRVVDDERFLVQDFNDAFVLMHYFAYLRRDPDEAGYNFWLKNLNQLARYREFNSGFRAAAEQALRASSP